ncbi:MAG: DNA double-strand break repair nuclease NurA [Candidatus Diapherotrites archaeon]|nr:DNA double-strand break repair nuclease NurA [Candidatus Diapherotrites archaeon]
MQRVLEEIAERIVKREEERQRMGAELRSTLEDFIQVAPGVGPTATVGAVDGGVVYEEYGSLILMLIRSVGAIFSYEEGALDSVDYVPSPLPDPEVVDSDIPLEREDYHPFRSLHRLRSELSRSLEVLARSPQFFFLDGSIVPQIVDKPRSDRLKPLYLSVVGLFKSLYSYYPNTLLGGIVKDSRGNRLGLFLREEGVDVPDWQDVSWLNYVLQPGEYTSPIPYSEEPSKHATLKDLGEHAENIYLFYLKASPLDRPYRVEFYSKDPQRDARRLASLLYPLSSLNPNYSIPPFLVEVDLRARLSKESMGYVKSYLERVLMARFPSLKLFERRPM